MVTVVFTVVFADRVFVYLGTQNYVRKHRFERVLLLLFNSLIFVAPPGTLNMGVNRRDPVEEGD